MKKSLKRSTRWGLIVTLSLLILCSAGIAAWYFQFPLEAEKQVPVYTCKQELQVDYRIAVMQNNFFPEQFIGPGQVYIIPLTQYIETALNYNFSGPEKVDISGQYQADAVLTGYVIKEKKAGDEVEKVKLKAWEKTWPLVAVTPFSAHDRTLQINQPVPVDIRFYADFAEQVAKEFKFSAELVELAVTYNIQGKAVTEQGEINEPVQAALIIPIKGNSFTVDSLQNNAVEKSITELSVEEVPGVKMTRIIMAGITALLAILLLMLLLLTAAAWENPSENELRRIFRKYSDRIATGFSWVPAISAQNTMNLNSFDDLLKVADEITQPILYESHPDGEHSFYVINEPLIYCFNLNTAAGDHLSPNNSKYTDDMQM